MTAKENKTYDNLLNLIISHGEAGKTLMDMLQLVAKMKAIYDIEQKRNED